MRKEVLVSLFVASGSWLLYVLGMEQTVVFAVAVFFTVLTLLLIMREVRS